MLDHSGWNMVVSSVLSAWFLVELSSAFNVHRTGHGGQEVFSAGFDKGVEDQMACNVAACWTRRYLMNSTQGVWMIWDTAGRRCSLLDSTWESRIGWRAGRRTWFPDGCDSGNCYAMGVKDQVACLAGVLGTWFPDRFDSGASSRGLTRSWLGRCFFIFLCIEHMVLCWGTYRVEDCTVR